MDRYEIMSALIEHWLTELLADRIKAEEFIRNELFSRIDGDSDEELLERYQKMMSGK